MAHHLRISKPTCTQSMAPSQAREYARAGLPLATGEVAIASTKKEFTMAFQKRREATPSSLAQRILAIFEVFQQGSCTLTLSEISRRTGLPLTTSFRLLSTLTDWGALDRGPDRRYTIGVRIVDLAALAPPQQQERHLQLAEVV